MKSVWACVLAVLLSLSAASGCSERLAPQARGDESTTQNPTVERDPSPPSDREIQVVIDSNGRYTVEGQRCDVGLLEDTLGKLKGKAKNPSVRILCGSDAEFKLVQQVIGPAMRLEMGTIRLQTSPGQAPAAFTGICAGPWHVPVLHIRVFPQRVTVTGEDSSAALLSALLQGNAEGKEKGKEFVAFVQPQKGAKVGLVYAVLRACEASTVEFGLVEHD